MTRGKATAILMAIGRGIVGAEGIFAEERVERGQLRFFATMDAGHVHQQA